MPRTEVRIPTPDGVCAATLHTASDGPAPAVILFIDAGGVREVLLAMADRIAELGYTTLLPDLYYRTPFAPFDVLTLFDDPTERARLGALMQGLSAESVRADTGVYLDFLADRPEVMGAAVGTTGYCMGGRFALLAAADYPERVAAAASFHGGNLALADDPASVDKLAEHIRATVYVAAARGDDAFPPEQFDRLKAALTAAGVTHTLLTYPAEHGFSVADNPTHDPAAEQRHWDALADLYGTALAR